MFMNFKTRENGFSLIEIIIGVLIVGIGFVGSSYAFSAIRSMSIEIEVTFRAVSVANSVMHTIRANNYDENSEEPWTGSLGPEEGSSAHYDDVDDYAGYAWDFQPKGFPGYDITTRVYYVNPTVSWTDSVGSETNYKHIIVQVSHDGLKVPITLASLITPKTSVDISDNDPCGTCGNGAGGGDDDDDDDHDDDDDDDDND